MLNKPILIGVLLFALLALFMYTLDPVRPVNTHSAIVLSSGTVPGSRLFSAKTRLSVRLADGRHIFIDVPLTSHDYVGHSIVVTEHKSYVFGRHIFSLADKGFSSQ